MLTNIKTLMLANANRKKEAHMSITDIVSFLGALGGLLMLLMLLWQVKKRLKRILSKQKP